MKHRKRDEEIFTKCSDSNSVWVNKNKDKAIVKLEDGRTVLINKDSDILTELNWKE